MCPSIVPGLPLAKLLSIIVAEVTRRSLARNPFCSSGTYFLWPNGNSGQPRRWTQKLWEIESYQHLKFFYDREILFLFSWHWESADGIEVRRFWCDTTG